VITIDNSYHHNWQCTLSQFTIHILTIDNAHCHNLRFTFSQLTIHIITIDDSHSQCWQCTSSQLTIHIPATNHSHSHNWSFTFSKLTIYILTVDNLHHHNWRFTCSQLIIHIITNDKSFSAPVAMVKCGMTEILLNGQKTLSLLVIFRQRALHSLMKCPCSNGQVWNGRNTSEWSKDLIFIGYFPPKSPIFTDEESYDRDTYEWSIAEIFVFSFHELSKNRIFIGHFPPKSPIFADEYELSIAESPAYSHPVTITSQGHWCSVKWQGYLWIVNSREPYIYGVATVSRID